MGIFRGYKRKIRRVASRIRPFPPPLPYESGGLGFISLRITSTPSGAATKIDGVSIGKTPITTRTRKGLHILTLEKCSYVGPRRGLDVLIPMPYGTTVIIDRNDQERCEVLRPIISTGGLEKENVEFWRGISKVDTRKTDSVHVNLREDVRGGMR